MKNKICFFLKSFSLLVLFFGFLNEIEAQIGFYTQNEFWYNKIDQNIASKKQSFASAFKPYVFSNSEEVQFSDSLIFSPNRFWESNSAFVKKVRANYFWRKLRKEAFIHVKEKDFKLVINPLFTLMQYKYADSANYIGQSYLSLNTRGVQIYGSIGDKFSFYTDFFENQAFYPKYLDDYIRKTVSIPGQGVPKNYKAEGHDFSNASGYLIYAPSKHWNFVLGNGKNFWGEGYRSLLLSDFTTSYPFFKVSFQSKYITYRVMYAEYMGFDVSYWHFGSGELAYRNRKYAAFNEISFTPNSFIQLSLIESVIWNVADSTQKEIAANFFNPLIFSKALSYGLHGSNNVILGANIKINPIKNIQLYGQFVGDQFKLSDTKNHKVAWQAGCKIFDLSYGLIPHFYTFVQVEHNQANPYTYMHEDLNQNFTHLNLPLAHPLGANFKENLIRANIIFRDFFIHLSYSNILQGLDSLGLNNGSDLLQGDPDFDDISSKMKIGQGFENRINFKRIQLGYTLNHQTNFQILICADFRDSKKGSVDIQENFYYFGIRTYIKNIYSDF